MSIGIPEMIGSMFNGAEGLYNGRRAESTRILNNGSFAYSASIHVNYPIVLLTHTHTHTLTTASTGI